ncbi:MAG: hypothetical protein R3E36_07625 [Nitrosomonas sp.]|nr:hypothetical protein [Nitrosomonas sp.]MCP5292475.1 hypothetical protein [Burkholderiales bacterium]MDR4520457.1 hypothetical protein [Nitrosomonas sp.]
MPKIYFQIKYITLFLVTLCFAQSVHSLPVYQNVVSGEYFAIDFQFLEVPFESTGDADILLANGGAVSNGLLGSTVLLFHEGILVSTFSNPMANTFALFKDPTSLYTVWGASVDLTAIFHGGIGRMEFHPIFDPSVKNAFVNYQLTSFGATQSTGMSIFSDTLVTPQIISSNAALVSLPSSFALIIIGAFGFSFNNIKLRSIVYSA